MIPRRPVRRLSFLLLLPLFLYVLTVSLYIESDIPRMHV